MKKLRKLAKPIISLLVILSMVLSVSTPVMAQAMITESIDSIPMSDTANDESAMAQGNIIGEDKSLRDEYTKYFITDAGTTIVAQYAVPVHYKDDNGEYIDFDNSLTSSQVVSATPDEAILDETTIDEVSYFGLRTLDKTPQTEEVLVNRKSNSKVSHYKKSGKANLIEIERDGHKISWGYSGANVVTAKEQENKTTENLTGNDAYLVLPNLSSAVLYENIYNNVDLEVINSTTGVKENIILKATNTKNVFKIEYNIGDLIAESEDAHTIVLKDSTGKKLYSITAPYMKDANGETSKALELKILSNNNGRLSVKLTADKTWLYDNSRSYPVTIDPAFIYGQNDTQIESTYVYSGSGSTDYSGEEYIFQGSDTGGVYESYLKLTSLPQLKSGDMIVYASLNQYLLNNYYSATSYVGLYDIDGDWTANSIITYNNKPETEALVDYELIKSSDTEGWKNWDITKLVKGWYNGAENNGFMLKNIKTTGSTNPTVFVSSSMEAYPTAKPCLELHYRNNKGIESYWSYTSVNCGRAGTAYINDYSGNLTFNMPIASTASPSLAASLSFIYNSGNSNEKYTLSSPYMGRKWNMNIQQTVKPTSTDLLGESQPMYPYVYTDADGTEHYFYKKTEGSIDKYYDEDGLGLELTLKNSEYIITDKNYNKLTFNSSGLLKSSTNKAGHSITITYNGTNITSIKDNEGDAISFTGLNSSNYVTEITDSDGKTTAITYANARISKVTYNDGKAVSFTYDSNGNLTSVIDTDGSKVVFTYAAIGSRGCTSATEYGVPETAGATGPLGQIITFNRREFNTTLIQTCGSDGQRNTNDDVFTTCRFDNFGKLTASNSETKSGIKLSASSASYTSDVLNSDASNIKSINKVSQSYAVGAATDNLLYGHNMESQTNWGEAKWGNGTATFDASINTNPDHVMFGSGSYKINVSAVTGDARGRIYQDVSKTYLEPGEMYTLSCYVKTTAMAPIAQNDTYGAVIAITPFYADGSSSNVYSEHISNVTDEEINNGFRRISVGFVIPTDSDFSYLRINLAVHSAIGTAYFDGVQLEKANTPSHYNMLENSGFERSGPASWAETGTVDADGRCTNALEGSAALYVRGDVLTAKNFHQDVMVSGSKNDTYILSGWAQGNAVPNDTNNSSFELRARVYYSDGSSEEKRSAPFNTTIGKWQYASFAFNLDNGETDDLTPTKIRVYAISFRQGSTVCFDNLMLTEEAVPSYTYDSEGNLKTVVENAQQSSSYEYEDNLLTKYVDPVGNNYTYTYDETTNLLTTATNSNGTTYTYTYDTKNNPNSVLADGGANLKLKANVDISYPAQGASTYSVTSKGQNGYDTTNVYNAKNGTLQTSSNVIGTNTYYYYNSNNTIDYIKFLNQQVSYDYSNDYKHLTGITHGNTTYSFTYDSYGNVKTSEVGNRILATNTYTGNNGNLNMVEYGNGQYVGYSYDPYGNIIAVYHDNNTIVKNFSNSRGDIIRSVDRVNNLVSRYYYDTTGRLTTKDIYTDEPQTNIDTWRRSLNYGYDLNNNVSRFDYTDHLGARYTLQYLYDADNLPAETIVDDNNTESYAYDTLNRLTQKNVDTRTDIKHFYTYAQSKRGSEYTTTNIETEISNAFAYKYFYDKRGNIIGILSGTKMGTYDYSFPNVTSHTQCHQYYEYDLYNQLIHHYNMDTDTDTLYSYDNDGNITEKEVTVGSTTTTYTYTYADTQGWGDLLTNYNGQPITYDAIGNPLTYRDGMTMTWQAGRQLAALSKNGKNISYTYDSNGLRTKKSIVTSSGTTEVEYFYEGSTLMQMKKGTVNLYFLYNANGTPLGFIYYDVNVGIFSRYYYGVNTRGDIIALYNNSGTILALYDYDAYGNPISVTNSSGTPITSDTALAHLNPLRYRGYVYDNETGLYYLQSRYYDPITCRFINADSYISTGQDINGFNMFVYCNNNPVMYFDPTGEYVTYSGVTYSGVEFHNVPTYQLGCYGQIKDYWVDGEVIVITKRQLIQMGFCNVTSTMRDDLNAALQAANINSINSAAHFLAQCAVETNYGMWLTEIGDESYFSTQEYGYKYRGGGYIQLTWDFNYKSFAEYMGDSQIYEQGADYVADNYAWAVAGWFWTSKNINSVISGNNVDAVTSKVNYYTDTYAQRRDAYTYIYGVLG